MSKILISVLLGTILGILGSRYLFVGSALSLVVWAIIGLFIGYWTDKRKTSVINGIIYGFFLSFIFMVAGYEGDNLVSALPFFILLGLFGSFCGSILGLIGFGLKRFIK